ncbi:hypothetical protein [Jidongwangia harbinensis]|uniref:hypothetical protein n=1 Tax=Jidongwangia harbinensis TaxID=2878561 RepID=UPI001CD9E18B|nr:hypothetical protein [Jidongwangia harbinensis]MCA2214197.1 hypothetical protein [Jidongwangia harbinensis]
MIAGRRVVPSGWSRRTWGRRLPHLAVGALGESGYDHYGYSTLWWTVAAHRPAVTGLGVHGQYLFVDPVADVVIVKCSAWPALDDERRDRETVTALRRVAEDLG